MAPRSRAYPVEIGRAAAAFSKSALMSPAPRNGEVKRTSLPDTFDGIRFEIGRMAQYVKEAARDPIVMRQALEIQSTYGKMVSDYAEMSGMRLGQADRKALKLQAIDDWCRDHFVYVNDPPNIEVIQTPRRMVKETKVPARVLEFLMTPFYDAFQAAGYDVSTYTPKSCYTGDCVPYSQRIIVQDKFGAYRIVSIGDLEHSYRDFSVLSWNERESKVETKRIERFVDKGTLPVFKIQLSNGTSFRCTRNHQLYVLWREGRNKAWRLVTMTLDQLLERRAERRTGELFMMPVARQIPEASVEDAPEISEEQAWIEGLYVAEGWREGPNKKSGNWRARIGMNNPEAIAKLQENFDFMGLSHGQSVRKSDGLVTVSLHVSAFTNRLASEFGENSASRKFPGAYLSLPREIMAAALEAFCIGDGYKAKSGDWARWTFMIYNTQSEQLARQIAFMHLVLGRPLSFYRQPAWKTKPVMYRLYEYKGYAEDKVDGLVGTRIVSIEADEAVRCCDITVEGNHNFFLEGGVLVHNCDEAVVGMQGLAVCTFPEADMEMNGPSDAPSRYFFQFGGNEGTLHHVWAKTLLGGAEYHADHTEPGYKLGDHSKFDAYEDVEILL